MPFLSITPALGWELAEGSQEQTTARGGWAWAASSVLDKRLDEKNELVKRGVEQWLKEMLSLELTYKQIW